MTQQEAESLIDQVGHYEGNERRLLGEVVREAVEAERLRWLTAGICDPTAQPAHLPDARGLVHYILTGTPQTVEAALRAISERARRGEIVGIVGAYTPLPSDQFAAVAKGEREAERQRIALLAGALGATYKATEPNPDGPGELVSYHMFADRILASIPVEVRSA